VGGLGVFENEVLMEVFVAKREEVRGGWKNCIARSFMICAAHQILLAEDEWAEPWQLGVWENRNAYRILVGRLQGRGSLKDMGTAGRIILKGILKERDGRAWSEMVWLSGQTRGGVL